MQAACENSKMRHQLTASADGLRIAHYAPATETLSVLRLPAKQTGLSKINPVESLSIRIAPVSSLSMHPELPVLLGIPLKRAATAIPKGPSSLNGSLISYSSKPAQSALSPAPAAGSVAKTKSKIQLTLYSFYSRPMVSTPLIIEVELADVGSITPWCIKYSPSGRFLALHSRAYSSSNSHETYQLFIFDTKNNYSFVTYTKLENGLEELEWNHGSDILLGAGSGGALSIFEFDQMNGELSLKKSLNLSSSALSSISYHEQFSEKAHSKPRLLVGTKDGNTFFIDPVTMCCTHSLLSDTETPILKVSMGPDSVGVVVLESAKEQAQVLRISDQDNDYEKIATVEDIYPTSSTQSGNVNAATGCGALITKFGIIAYVKKDSKLCVQTITELLSSTNDDKTKTETKAPKRDNPRKRSADLFNRVKSRDEPRNGGNGSNLKKQKENYGKSQRDYWDSRQSVRDREKDSRERNLDRERDRDRERDSWRYKRVSRK